MIRCIAIDDEPLALEQLKSYISKVPYLQLVAACHDAFEAIEAMGNNAVDAVFADINMPDLSGIDLVRSMSKQPIVVFTTAYADYAVAGYKVNAVDYLLKPFGLDEFLVAAEKVRRQHELLVSAGVAGRKASPEAIYVKSDYRMQRIAVADIVFVESMAEYVRITTANGSQRPLMTLLSMRRIENILPEGVFLRVHKSFIVNMRMVKSVSKTSIETATGATIPIGDTYRQAVADYIDNHGMRL